MIWSYLRVDCLEHWNQGLYLDGKDDFILLDDILTLKMEERYVHKLMLTQKRNVILLNFEET